MALTNKGLVKFVKKKLGVNYVYGMKGTVMTMSNYTTLKRLYSNIVRDSDVNKVGTVCVDCSGLIAWYTDNIKSSQMYHDEADKLHNVHTIDTICDAPIGAAVWRKGHIGVYIGDGEIIEARGAAYGVVKTKVKDRDFTHWFKLKDISYKDDYYPKYKGTTDSIVLAFKDIGIKDTSLSHRRRIAFASGIVKSESSYTGTAEQNIKMLKLLKKGKLVKAV